MAIFLWGRSVGMPGERRIHPLMDLMVTLSSFDLVREMDLLEDEKSTYALANADRWVAVAYLTKRNGLTLQVEKD